MLASIAFNSRSYSARFYRKAIRLRDFFFASINESPIFLLGNQKSGTTVMGLLLADATGLSVTIDLYREIFKPEFQTLPENPQDFEAFLAKNRIDFSRDIIKEPNLTLFFPELKERFPGARFLFIVRQPHDNIRSILDNLKIKGDLTASVEELCPHIPEAWRYVIDNRWRMVLDTHYIASLCARWNYMADVYLENRETIQIVRYEDFRKQRQASIHLLAESLNLRIVNDISTLVDRQYQPRGQNRDIDTRSFYSPDNFQMIQSICGERMKLLGY
jgi:hypothetical protein